MTTPSLSLVITKTGLQRFVAAQLGEDIDMTISSVALTAAAFVAAPTLTALPGEFRRVATISGVASSADTVHLVVRDAAELRYEVRGLGLFLADGTLFATYGQAEPIFEKSARSTMHIAIDLVFPTGTATSLTFGDTNFLQPPATETLAGVIELATPAEVTTGTDPLRAITPATLAGRLAALTTNIDAAIAGVRASLASAVALLVPLTRRISTSGLAIGGQTLATDMTVTVPPATADQLRFATAGNVAVTPASFGDLGNVIAPTGSYTLPGGRVDKWGKHRARANSEVTVAIVFDPPFPAECFNVSLTPFITSPNPSDDYFCQLAGDPTRFGFTVQYQSDDANGGLSGFDWTAIGH
ncbi:hypothetical protein ASE67_01510 [Sphingomonas sp. Leaf23]|uniref:gp53-like domain-containing protein n=1 Tax=Sphingomonas sp. Leaf23 TaxID=1735689 RepID=UPI0006F1F804|nr:hypothetical protein [Sphingomonas sp. Leaf23]KQM88463.1 hypothetical protein ASE67_01510 [Sphingomonas sp. Leaf23]